MNCCSNPQCRGIEQIFDDSVARKELKEYKRKGVKKTTRLLLNAVQNLGVKNASLLDIGGGIGAIQLELLQAGVAQVTNVDASPAYSNTARDEATRLGWGDRVSYHVGNFVDLAPTLPSAEIVTLDRVICCYNDMPALVQASVDRARRVYAVVFPKDVWWIKAGIGLANGLQKVFRHPFRIFAHPTEEVEALVRARGFERVFTNRGLFWQVIVYAKG
ncbi:MAG: methyltransferase domain-containing protein [Anaerolineales bacterium]|nr:methyltransferase domain-containing protein [Anaerolineales bacterium]